MHVSSLRYNHGHPTYCSYSLVGVLWLLPFLSSLVLILWLLLHGFLHGARTTFGHPFYLDLLQVLYDRCHLIHCLLKHCEQGSCIGNLRFFPVTSICLGCKWWHLSTAWYLWAPGAGPRQKGEIHAEAWPPASTRRTLGRYPFHTTSPRSIQGEWIHSPSDVGTEPIHFHQECTA